MKISVIRCADCCRKNWGVSQDFVGKKKWNSEQFRFQLLFFYVFGQTMHHFGMTPITLTVHSQADCQESICTVYVSQSCIIVIISNFSSSHLNGFKVSNTFMLSTHISYPSCFEPPYKYLKRFCVKRGKLSRAFIHSLPLQYQSVSLCMLLLYFLLWWYLVKFSFVCESDYQEM